LVSFHTYFSVKKTKGKKQVLHDIVGMKNKLLAKLSKYLTRSKSIKHTKIFLAVTNNFWHENTGKL